MKLTVSTRNPSKAEQIGALLKNLPLQVESLEEAGIVGEVVEDGTTLEENATKKALFAHQVGHWSVADDTGLFIDALDGQPGIFAARWAGEDATTEDIMNFTLGKLQNVPKEQRAATFRTCAVLITPDGDQLVFFGEVPGTLLTSPRVPCQPKMPYSAIFVPQGQEKAWAEMTVEEENAISHRGIAFRKLRSFLERVLLPSNPGRPGSGLPKVPKAVSDRNWEELKADPDHFQKLLAQAKCEFDEKWGIDPETPTDYGSI